MGAAASALPPGTISDETMKALDTLPDAAKAEIMAKMPPMPAAPAAKTVDLPALFKEFDTSGDGKLSFGELSRAFRALGLSVKGKPYELSDEDFKSFDTDGTNTLTVDEFVKGLHARTVKKIEELVAGGWTFDKEKWASSQERHKTWNMSKVFKVFDTDSDGHLTMVEFKRAFRAIGLKQRSGEKLTIDDEMFKSFDTNGATHARAIPCEPEPTAAL